MAKRLVQLLLLLEVPLAAACVTDASTGPGRGGGGTSLLAAAMPLCSTSGQVPSFFKRRLGCGETLRIGPAAGSEDFATEIAVAANAWTAALRDSVRTPGMPGFLPVTGTGRDVTVIVESGAGPYCGHVDTASSTVHIDRTGCSGPVGDVTTTLTHELSHILGFGDDGEGLGQPGVSDGCTTNLNLDNTINPTVCQHDVEVVLSVYGYRGAIPVDFWYRPIVTDLALDTYALNLAVGETQTVTATQLVFARPGVRTTGGGSNAPPPGGEPDSSLAGVALTWTRDDELVSLIPSGFAVAVAGQAGGTTKVRGGVSTLPAAYQLGGIFATMGTAVPVTVTGNPPPPPGSGFRVISVNGAPAPITTAGMYALTVTTADQPNGTLTVSWSVSYSNGVLTPKTTSFSPPPYQLEVPAGSYNIHLTATPRVGGNTGTAATVDFPVCTGGGGGGDLAAPRAPPTPNRVGGC